MREDLEKMNFDKLQNEKLRETYSNRVAVVVNGNAKQVTDEIVEVLDQIVQSGDLFVSRSLEEGHQIARSIVEKRYPVVLTGGGDGTFVQMVTWVTEEAKKLSLPRPKFGFLRLGTGNALASVLGTQNSGGKGLVADLARLKKSGGGRKLRLLDVEGVLSPFAGVGIDAIAVDHFNQVKEVFEKIPVLKKFATGGIAYITSVSAKTIPYCLKDSKIHVRIFNEGDEAVRLGMDGRPVGKPIGPGELIFEGGCRMTAFSTIPFWGFGARIFPFAEDQEEFFSLRVSDVGPASFVLNLPKIWNGTFRHERLHDFLVKKIRVECREPTPVQVGGDVVEKRSTVRVSLCEEKLEVVDYYSPPSVTDTSG